MIFGTISMPIFTAWPSLFHVSQSKSETGSNSPLHLIQAERCSSSPSLFLQHVQTIRSSATSSLADCMTKTDRGWFGGRNWPTGEQVLAIQEFLALRRKTDNE